MSIHHVTVTNQPTNLVFKLMTNVTNLGDKFPSVRIGHDKGMGYKVILLRQYLDFLPESDYVLFTDAHDIRIIGSHEEIMARYFQFGSKIVFAAEKNCWPQKALESQYRTRGPYKYLNSGGFIGEVGALKMFIDENFQSVSGVTDDQVFYTNLYLKFQTDRARVQLDTRCTIFQCLHLAMEDIDQESLKNMVTGTRPLVWHSNGYLHQFFMEKLCGLEYTPQVKLEIDQQLISPCKNVIALTTQTLSPSDKKYFFKTFHVSDDSLRETQKKLHAEYPTHWFCIIKEGLVLPPKFDYLVYGRVLDTRKMYMMLTQQGITDKFQLYYDKTKYTYEDFLLIEILST